MTINKNIVIGILGVVVLLAGLAWIGRPKEETANTSLLMSRGVLAAVEHQSFDFGTISMKAGKVSHMFQFKNTGEEPVTIGQIYTSCMCTNAKLMFQGLQFGPYGMPGHGFTPKVNKAIGPGEEASVEVVFDPAAHGPAGVGNIQRSVILENNAGEPLEFQISATVTP